jgi:hypothetical protein
MMKSNGGVFGRNPTFQNVTVDGTLTANSGISLSSGNITVPSGSGISFASTSDPSIPATSATGTITRTATNVSNNDTVTLGSQVYTFKTTLTPADYEVLIGADSTASLLNLARAINNSGGTPGTDYQVPAANASASAGTIVGSTIPVTALTAGTAGNSIALAETSAQLSVSAATLLGGRAAQGTTSELLADYEEGTFNPTFVTSGTAFTSVTYGANNGGRYIKIGNVVHVQMYVSSVAAIVGSATGALRVGGLPYTSVASSQGTQNGVGVIAVGYGAGFATNGAQNAWVRSNSTVIDLYCTNAITVAPATQLVAANMGTGSVELVMAGTYIAA